jgi:hypothetical protein
MSSPNDSSTSIASQSIEKEPRHDAAAPGPKYTDGVHRGASSSLSRTLSHAVLSLTRLPSRSLSTVVSRDDGFDNFPPPLPGSQHELERVLTDHPDIERQMVIQELDIGPPPEGGREAWLVVISAFFVLFCVFGFSESKFPTSPPSCTHD